MRTIIFATSAAAFALAIIPSGAQATPSDDLISVLQCGSDESLNVVTGGIEDNYAGGTDTATPRTALTDSTDIIAYQTHHNNQSFRQYDQGGNNNFFLETLANPKPSNAIATRGMIILKFKPTGSLYETDHVLIGDLSNHGAYTGNGTPKLTTADYAHATTPTMPGGAWSSSNGMFYAMLLPDAPQSNGLKTRDQQTSMLDFINGNGNNEVDFLIQDDSNVDFVKIAVCSRKQGKAALTLPDGTREGVKRLRRGIEKISPRLLED